MTIGQMLHQWLTKLEWFSTLFPRIPVPIQKQIESKINNYCQQNNVNFAAQSVSQPAPIEPPEKGRQEWREKSAERKRGRDRSRERQPQNRNDDRYESRRGYGSKSKEREREHRHR